MHFQPNEFFVKRLGTYEYFGKCNVVYDHHNTFVTEITIRRWWGYLVRRDCIFSSIKASMSALDVPNIMQWTLCSNYNSYEFTRYTLKMLISWWRDQMETISALLAICAGNSPVPGEFPAQRPVTRSSDVFFDLRLNKRLGMQSWGWWFEMLSRQLWRHCNVHRWTGSSVV